MHRILAVLCLSVLFATPAQANEQVIRRTVEPSKLNGGKIDVCKLVRRARAVRSAPGFSQKVQILYTDAKAENIIVGNIYESKTDRNLTEERIARLSAIKFDSLPLEQAVKIVRGNGKRVMAMFSDPYCPACQSFVQKCCSR